MSIKDTIAKGIGFNPGSVKFIPTQGYDSKPTGLTNKLGDIKSTWWWWDEEPTSSEGDRNA